MATGGSSSGTSVDINISGKMDQLLCAVEDIKKSQECMKRMFESKPDKLKADLMQNIEGKVRDLRDEIVLDINRELGRIDQLLTTVHEMQTRLDSLEHSGTHVPPRQDANKQQFRGNYQGNPLDDPDLTITASDIPVTVNEDLINIAKEDIIKELGEEVFLHVTVTAATRLRSRIPGRPGLVKISFLDTSEKVLVLRNKMKLKDSESYKNVFIKSSKSHVERLIELNHGGESHAAVPKQTKWRQRLKKFNQWETASVWEDCSAISADGHTHPRRPLMLMRKNIQDLPRIDAVGKCFGIEPTLQT